MNTPRMAASVEEIRAGQVAAIEFHASNRNLYTHRVGQISDATESGFLLAGWGWVNRSDVRAAWILSDPPPEPVTVPRDVYDRLVEMLNWNPRYQTQLDEAAVALVDAVEGNPDWDWRRRESAEGDVG